MATETRVKLARIGYSDIYSFQEDATAFAFEAGMEIDADGAYTAYNPDNKSGLDYLANAGHPGNWFGVVTDDGNKTGNPVVQNANDPAPGFYVSATSLQDKTQPRTSPLRYVDAASIPYIVLPTAGRFGAQLGDLCLVHNPQNGNISGGVFADSGPAGKIGEASVAMATAVGVPSSAKNGGQGHGLVYMVFPKSGKGWPLTNDVIQDAVTNLFNTWGGLDRLKILLPDPFNI